MERRPSLAEIREEQSGQDPVLRERIMAATLAVSGERGYGNATVREVFARYGGYRVQFYSEFASFAEAYLAAYEVHAERLCAELLEIGRSAKSWRTGLRAALDRLAEFANEDPRLARGLLTQVFEAGEPALARREEVLERLSHAVDSARRETGSRHSPPPLTAPFMVSAIESAVSRAVDKREAHRFAEAVPELERLVSAAYFGHRVRPL